jgi:hypothetical protein
MVDIERARAAKQHLRRDLDGRDGIRAIGLGRGEDGYRLQVGVASRADADGLPAEVDGVTVRVRVVGAVQAQA